MTPMTPQDATQDNAGNAGQGSRMAAQKKRGPTLARRTPAAPRNSDIPRRWPLVTIVPRVLDRVTTATAVI